MGKKGLWIALMLLALVGGGIGYLVYRDNQGTASPAPSENRILAGGLTQLSSIRLQRPDEAAIQVTGSDPASWRIVEPAPYACDPLVVGDLVGVLRSLEAERTLEPEGYEPQAFGLHAPMMWLTLREGDQEHLLEFGGVNPIGAARYVRLRGSPKLYLVSIATVAALNRTLGDLRQKKVLDATEQSAHRISLESPAGNREIFRRDSRDWTFTDPPEFFADQSLMTQMVSSIVSLRTDAAALNGKPMAEREFLALPLYARIRVRTETAEQTTELRGRPGAVFAHSESLGGIYPVSAEIDTYLRKPLADFRDMRVFRFGFLDVFQLRYEGGAKVLELQKPNENWLLGGKTVDTTAANKLVDVLRGASAAEYIEGEAPGEPTHTVKVEVSDGREETVRFGKTTGGIFAVRAGERGYYKLPESFLNDLEAAAGGLAP